MTKNLVLTATTLGALLAAVLVFGRERSYKSDVSQNAGHRTDLSELRAKFNADKGKVRLMMLLSPT